MIYMTTISNYVSDERKIINSKPIERIASLDFQRGLAIFLMIFVHGAANIIDYTYIEEDPTVFLQMPIPVIMIFVTLAFFAVWNSYFLFISVTVNSFAMARGIENGKDPKKILIKQLLTGIGLLFVNIIQNSFLASGYFGVAIRTGDWSNTYPLWNGFFSMGTLRIIGLSLIINSLLLYFLLRKDGYKQFTRNVSILGFLTLIIIIASPFIHKGVDNLNWIFPIELPPNVEIGVDVWWPNTDFQALNASSKSFFCTLLAGDVEPLFPYLASAFIGAIIGLCLAKPKQIKRFPMIGGFTGLGAMVIGGLFLAFGTFTFGTMRPSIGNYLVMLGGQICSMFLLFWLIEFRAKSQKFGNNIIVKHFRLWGMVSLSLFTLDILDMLPRWVFGLFYNLLFKTNINAVKGNVFGQGQEYTALFYAIVSVAFFEIVVLLWSRINFFLSFEWCVVRLVGLITKEPSKRLNVDLIMNKVHWIEFKSNIQPTRNILLV